MRACEIREESHSSLGIVTNESTDKKAADSIRNVKNAVGKLDRSVWQSAR
ncbi:hypothetical protein PAMC26577_22125 [Caballeronia sordidicola]|uniref:Uncharacterized protein n=1 Tax=Caballeronia sordidicola TaxID=196367 RepID=A0A242MK28_CABSO|nr:hypothetical protein PAMC26577_22125 [Caballeronia sordidicola]